MDTSTIVYIVIAIVGVGLSAFVDKLATNEIGPKTIVIIFPIMAIISFFYFIVLGNGTPGWSSKGIAFSVLSGVFWAIGNIGLYTALQKDNVSIISPMAALYPMIAIVLGVLVLHEKIKTVNAIGILFALLASVLLAL